MLSQYILYHSIFTPTPKTLLLLLQYHQPLLLQALRQWRDYPAISPHHSAQPFLLEISTQPFNPSTSSLHQPILPTVLSPLLSFCAGLNRDTCESTANTCGPCKAGFLGIIGPFNARCAVNATASSSVGHACSVSSDCVFGGCVDGLCTVGNKACPSSCSGHGVCHFFDSAANGILDTCPVTEGWRCFSQCSCDLGYGGVDCSLSGDAVTQREALRVQMPSPVEHLSGAG